MKLRIEANAEELETRGGDLIRALVDQLPEDCPDVHRVVDLLKGQDPLSDQGPLRFRTTRELYQRMDAIYYEETERLLRELEAILAE